jgi:Catalase
MLLRRLAPTDPFSSKVCAVDHHTTDLSLYAHITSDFHHIDALAHFDRERIPERVVCVILILSSYPKFSYPTLC